MAKILTEAQREAANKRKRDARALKKRQAADPLSAAEVLPPKTGKLKKIEDIDFSKAEIKIVNPGAKLPKFVRVEDDFTAEQLATVPGALELFLEKKGIDLNNDQLESLKATLAGTNFPYEPFSVGMIAEAIVQRDEVRRAKVGDEVTAPRGGMFGIVHKRFRDGGVFVTGDGGNKEGGWCEHAVASLPDNGVYYEFIDGQYAGEHGWLHRARGCNKVYQIG